MVYHRNKLYAPNGLLVPMMGGLLSGAGGSGGGGGTSVSLTTWALDKATARLGGNAYGYAAVYSADTDETVLFYTVNNGTDAVRCLIYDHTNEEWSGPFNVGPSFMEGDGHGWPSAELLDDGRMVVFHGSHGGSGFPQQWSLSDINDYTTWTRQPSLTADEPTYPKPVDIPDGGASATLYNFYRNNNPGTSGIGWPLEIIEGAYSHGGSLAFGAGTELIGFDGERIYTSRIEWDGTDFIICWTRANIADTYREDVYFAKYNPTTGDLTSLDGGTTVASASLPLDRTAADTNFRTHTGETFIPDFHLEDNGNIHLVYSDNGDTNPMDLNYDFWNGTSWAGKTKLDDLHNYNTGSGFKGQAARVILTSGGDIEVYYNKGSTGQTERGGDALYRRVDSGSGFAAAEELATETDYAVGFPQIVRYATDTIRTFASETFQSGTANDGDFLDMHVIGSGIAELPSGYTEPEFKYVVDQVDFTRMPDGSNNFLDASPAVYEYEFEGNATVTSGELILDGSGDLVRHIPPPNGTAQFQENRRFNFGTGDFTIELFGVKMNSLSGDWKHVYGHQGNAGDRGLVVTIKPSDGMRLALTPDGLTVVAHDVTLPYNWKTDGTEYYICICRNGSDLRFYVAEGTGDAVMHSKQTDSTDHNSSSSDRAWGIGGGVNRSGSRLDGSIKAVRFYNGWSRRTDDLNFTPPSLPLYDPAIDGYS